ncbi:MAG TPA: NADPH-dependent FMN reductase [Conexibacter sp.]|jgi:FMN reductase
MAVQPDLDREAVTAPPEVLVLTSSCREGSSTARLGGVVAQALRDAGRRAALVHAGDLSLPWCTGAREQLEEPRVTAWREQARSTVAHVWVSAEWHGSMVGTLKNALDLLPVTDTQWKLVGLVAQAGGAMGAINALGHMRTVGQNLGTWVLPTQLSVSPDDLGPPLRPQIAERLERFTREFDDAFTRLDRVM